MSEQLESKIVARLREILGKDAVAADDDELLVYECDAMTTHKSRPLAVVFPSNTEQVSFVVKLLAEHGIPFGPRGAGTGLSSGAVAVGCEKGERAVIIEMARMNKVLEVDYANRRAVVQPGLINVRLSQAVAARGYHYAPDPSSQTSCTIGGNVAENAGGPHCLKYGATTNHILGLSCLPAKSSIWAEPEPIRLALICWAHSSAAKARWALPPKLPCD